MGTPLPLCPPALQASRLVPPYGWRYDEGEGRWVPYPPEQATLRQIFDLHSAGRSLRDICLALEAEGNRTRKGSPWTSSAVRQLLARGGRVEQSPNRAKSLPPRRLSDIERAEVELLERVERGALFLARRPRRRGQCQGFPGFCPFVSCRYHLGLDVKPSGTLKIYYPEGPENHLEIDVDRMAESCALDVADRGGATLEEVGELLNMTRENVRQIEEKALEKLREENPGLFRYLLADHDPGAKKR
jgi:hypothetical protein